MPEIAKFLGADMTACEFRPTKLERLVKVDRYLYPAACLQSSAILGRRQAIRKVQPNPVQSALQCEHQSFGVRAFGHETVVPASNILSPLSHTIPHSIVGPCSGQRLIRTVSWILSWRCGQSRALCFARQRRCARQSPTCWPRHCGPPRRPSREPTLRPTPGACSFSKVRDSPNRCAKSNQGDPPPPPPHSPWFKRQQKPPFVFGQALPRP